MRAVCLLTCAAVLALAPAARADPARDAILADYLAQAKAADAGFAGFAPERGEALFRTRQGTGKPDTPACTTCHSENPTAVGENIRTGKAIEPIAVSANPKRFTNADDVEKWFGRNCREVLGRDCTAPEKGDFIAFMATQ
ncbi:MAG: DUF1924 domain-containing protein [Dongiaceae bacterium]